MKRGEVWTIAAGGPYTGKPRPAVIVQDDRFDATASITVCLFTQDETAAPLFRPSIEADRTNGLTAESRLMADKITTVPHSKLGRKVGTLSATDMLRLERAMLVFLGLSR